MKSKPEVAIDLDGVIANTSQIIEREVLAKGYKMMNETYYPIIFGINDSREFMDDIIDDIFTKNMREIKPYEGVNDNLFKEISIIADITILTARRPEYNYLTMDWLGENFPLSTFKLINRSSREKPLFVKDNGYLCLVEDRLRTANAAANIGVDTYMIYRRWNSGRRTHKNITRISNLSTFQSLLASRYKFSHLHHSNSMI